MSTLLREYRSAIDAYTEATGQLAKKIGVVPKSEYEILRAVADHARKRVNSIRFRMDKHFAEHKCDRPEIAKVAGQSSHFD
ncbi:MAG TPA: hypothetical protein VGL72_32775 [Bryobacteraceae bacterium]